MTDTFDRLVNRGHYATLFARHRGEDAAGLAKARRHDRINGLFLAGLKWADAEALIDKMDGEAAGRIADVADVADVAVDVADEM